MGYRSTSTEELDAGATYRDPGALRHDVSLARDLLTGLAADRVVGLADQPLKRLVSNEQRRREQAVGKGSPQEVAGPKIGRSMANRVVWAASAELAHRGAEGFR